MADYQLHFSPNPTDERFKLLEVPVELCSVIENALISHDPLSLAIKGQPGDDAVLCTADKTFGLRTVVLSNSLLVVSPVSDAASDAFPEHAVAIRDQVKEILELVPTIPKIHKLGLLLRGNEYDGQEEETQTDSFSTSFTYQDAKKEIQASDAELDRGLRDYRILNINGQLRPATPLFLANILELILNQLIVLGSTNASASVESLTSALADDHEVSRSVSTQVMSWFGKIREGKWIMDVEQVMREVGLSVLRNHKKDPIEEGILLEQWKTLVGDTFHKAVSLDLLAGNYLVATNNRMLTYFPASSLPVDPAARFRDLFLTRSRWKVDDITPFLTDIAVNIKERDKLLLKYARGITDSDGLYYTARAQYNG